MDSTVIDIANIMTSFGTHVVHSGVTLQVHRAEIFALIGGSGSGKSTLMREMILLQRPDSGSIQVLGADILALNDSEALALRSDAGTVGEVVYAVGSPFGQSLSGTITRGVLSARRVFEGVPFLQSDVAVNPGNSGGPLIDANGRVIGITVIGTGAQGINMFIPIDDVLDKLSLTLGSAIAAAPAAAPATK